MKATVMRPTSLYLTMRDGVRLAVDVYLPLETGRYTRLRAPTILRQTRYHRSMQLRLLHRRVVDSPPPYVQSGPYHSFKRDPAHPPQPQPRLPDHAPDDG